MTKLLCPRCMKSVTIPDDFTGREATCPSCNHSFEAPTRYTPTVLMDPVPFPRASADAAGVNIINTPASATPLTPAARTTESSAMTFDAAERPPAPPGLVSPPATVAPFAAVAGTAPGAMPPGYTRSHGLALSPRLVSWLPAILLTIAFIGTVFPWVGTSIGNNLVDSQGPWRAMYGGVNRNIELEKLMQTPDGWLDNVKSNWELLLPGLLALAAAVAFAWADHLDSYFTQRLSVRLANTWTWRHSIICGLSALAFALILFQVYSGFGLERAVRKVVKERFLKDREAAAGSLSKLEEVEYREQQEYAKFNLDGTFWSYLSLTCAALATLFMFCRIGLDRRGAKPPPRIVIQY